MWWMEQEWVWTTSWALWWHLIVKLATCSRATPLWHVSWAAARDQSGTEPNQAVKVRGNTSMLTEWRVKQRTALQLFGQYLIRCDTTTVLWKNELKCAVCEWTTPAEFAQLRVENSVIDRPLYQRNKLRGVLIHKVQNRLQFELWPLHVFHGFATAILSNLIDSSYWEKMCLCACVCMCVCLYWERWRRWI